MFAVFVEVDNGGEARDDRLKGLRVELAPAVKHTPGFQSGVFASNDSGGAGMMLVAYDTRENAATVAGRMSVGAQPRPGVTVKRVEVVEVIATA